MEPAAGCRPVLVHGRTAAHTFATGGQHCGGEPGGARHRDDARQRTAARAAQKRADMAESKGAPPSEPGRAPYHGEWWGLFFVGCLYSVDVIKSAKGTYLEI